MKRIGNLYQQICAIDNLMLADKKASRGKSGQYGIMRHNFNRESNIYLLQQMLINKTYTTSAYTTITIRDPKEREIYRLPYFPDRIIHHAVMNVLEPYFVSTFTSDTFSCIKGRGIHAASRATRKALNDEQGTQYCLKMDVRKFYPSIDNNILKSLLRRKFKDPDLLWLLDNIIDSTQGVPIGNYLSQYFANFYLSYFDHWIKEQKHVKYYFRYADDLVILADNKPYLHQMLHEIRIYMQDNLRLSIKDNYQVFPVWSRSLDFVGYRFWHTHTLLRKKIKQNFARKMARNPHYLSIGPYYGWAKHCNSRHLLKKLLSMKQFSQLGVKPAEAGFIGDKININRIINRQIQVHKYRIVDSNFQGKGNGKCLHLQIKIEDRFYVVFSGSGNLMNAIQQVQQSDFPFLTTIVKNDQRLEFS
jgi:RNA-directed DNA polymerase